LACAGSPPREADGGIGGSPLDLALVAESLGKAIAPDPWLENGVLPARLPRPFPACSTAAASPRSRSSNRDGAKRSSRPRPLDIFAHDGLQLPAERPLYGNAAPEPIGEAAAQLAAARFLNGKAWTVFGGSSEVQRNIIAKTVLGL
jgi:hypothetical protein